MTKRVEWMSHICGNVNFQDGGRGVFYYCSRCSSQADDIIETGVDEEDILDNKIHTNRCSQPTNASATRTFLKLDKCNPNSGTCRKSWEACGDTDAGYGVGPIGPCIFRSFPGL